MNTEDFRTEHLRLLAEREEAIRQHQLYPIEILNQATGVGTMLDLTIDLDEVRSLLRRYEWRP